MVRSFTKGGAEGRDAGATALCCIAIVPAYNEEASFARVIEDFGAADPLLDIVVIDDGSTDRTGRSQKPLGRKSSICRTTLVAAAPSRPVSNTRVIMISTSLCRSTATRSTTQVSTALPPRSGADLREQQVEGCRATA